MEMVTVLVEGNGQNSILSIILFYFCRDGKTYNNTITAIPKVLCKCKPFQKYQKSSLRK